MALLVIAACSTTSTVPDGDQLFTGLKKIVYTGYEKNDHALSTQEELEAALATAPNGALFGSSYYRSPMPYKLWIWNATVDAKTKLGKFMNRTFGKPPVLMSQVNPALRAQVARQVLRTNGYLHGDVTYEEVMKPGKTHRTDDGIVEELPKKAKIAYTVRMDSLFRVDSMEYVGFPPAMAQLIDSTKSEAMLVRGTPFSVANLDAERTRLSTLFKNNGYYYYQPAYTTFLADTFAKPFRAQMRLLMLDSLPEQALKPWYIGTTSVRMRRSMMEQTDSVKTRRFLKVMYNGKRPPMNERVVLKNMKLMPRRLYSYADYQESMQKVNATGVFSSVDFRFTPRDNDTLDLMLDCILDKPYDFYVETNFINRTIGRLGPEMKVGLTRRNAFRGGEKLDINLHGAYEWQTSSKGSDMDSYQYGLDASVEFPRLVLPWSTGGSRSRTGQPQRRRRRMRWTNTSTMAKVSTTVDRHPGYYKMHVVSGEWTYRWQPGVSFLGDASVKPVIRHELSPLTVKYQFRNSHTQKFDSLLTENPYLSTAMSDYFIPKMRYSFSYSSPKAFRNPLHLEFTAEESGNIMALYDVLVQGNGWKQKDKTFFKNPYSQFVKLEADVTKSWTLSQKSKLVGHLNVGSIWSYGNSSTAPFSENFYVGGANSIRAFPVRSIGPGSFMGFNTGSGVGGGRQFAYLMQNGNVKLVMNLELRQQLFGNLYGAVFLDAGNVWNSEDWTVHPEDIEDVDEELEGLKDAFVEIWNSIFSGNKLRARNFFKELATGTGVGLRYDLDFLVLRLDWGFGLHLPYDTGKSGYFNIRRFSDMHTLHIAIGYPF